MTAFDIRKNHKRHEFANHGHRNLLVTHVAKILKTKILACVQFLKEYKWHEFANQGHKKWIGQTKYLEE